MVVPVLLYGLTRGGEQTSCNSISTGNSLLASADFSSSSRVVHTAADVSAARVANGVPKQVAGRMLRLTNLKSTYSWPEIQQEVCTIGILAAKMNECRKLRRRR
jgi:hypothetical protein